MTIATVYNTGTASVANNNTAVTGSGTTWLTTGLQAGDLFWAAGLSCRIASVNSNTSITLAYGWPGSSLVAGTYEIRYTPDATRVLASARAAIDLLNSALVAAIAAAGSAANKLMYYTGVGTVALADLTAHGRSILGLTGGNGKFIRSTASGTSVMQDIVGTVAQSSGVPTGAIVERGSNANGDYTRFADGTQICTGSLNIDFTTAEQTGAVTYPAAFVGSVRPNVTLARNSFASTTSNFNTWIGDSTTTGFNIYARNNAGASTQTRTFYWQSFGRWFA